MYTHTHTCVQSDAIHDIDIDVETIQVQIDIRYERSWTSTSSLSYRRVSVRRLNIFSSSDFSHKSLKFRTRVRCSKYNFMIIFMYEKELFYQQTYEGVLLKSKYCTKDFSRSYFEKSRIYLYVESIHFVLKELCVSKQSIAEIVVIFKGPLSCT